MISRTRMFLSLCLVLVGSNVRSADSQIRMVDVDFGMPNGPDALGPLAVTEQAGGFIVQIPIANRDESKPRAIPPDVSNLHLQVWLLNADGTVVLQKSADRGPSMTGHMGAENWFVNFHFANAPPDQITAVVFSKQ